MRSSWLWLPSLLMLSFVSHAQNLLRGSPLNWSVLNGSLFLHQEEIFLRGITWNGLETEIMAPFGLWRHSMEYYMDKLRENQFNLIRVPFSSEWIIYNPEVKPFEGSVYKDQESINKTSLEILDLFFEKTERKGILVILNLARLHKDYPLNLWTQEPEYNTSTFLNSWFFILDRYKNRKNLLGIDIYNEPDGDASWTSSPNNTNSTNWNDWTLFVLSQITQRYPLYRWVFLIQGIHRGKDFQGLPNILNPNSSLVNRIIYSPHLQMNNTQREKLLVSNLYHEWDDQWGFLSIESKSVMIGKCTCAYFSPILDWRIEFLINYLQDKNWNNVFIWTLSNDPCEGILNEDWSTFDQDKMRVLENFQTLPTKIIDKNNYP